MLLFQNVDSNFHALHTVQIFMDNSFQTLEQYFRKRRRILTCCTSHGGSILLLLHLFWFIFLPNRRSQQYSCIVGTVYLPDICLHIHICEISLDILLQISIQYRTRLRTLYRFWYLSRPFMHGLNCARHTLCRLFLGPSSSPGALLPSSQLFEINRGSRVHETFLRFTPVYASYPLFRHFQS